MTKLTNSVRYHTRPDLLMQKIRESLKCVSLVENKVFGGTRPINLILKVWEALPKQASYNGSDLLLCVMSRIRQAFKLIWMVFSIFATSLLGELHCICYLNYFCFMPTLTYQLRDCVHEDTSNCLYIHISVLELFLLWL